MATVNKDFRVKNGLIVEGTTATVNGDNIITATATQTLTNKTIGSTGLVFNNGGTNQSIYADGSDFTIYGQNNVYINTNNADIILQPDGAAKVWGEVIATQTWVTSQGYLTSETDPVFVASDAYNITATDIGNWDTAYSWGNHASAGYLTSESDPVFTASDAYGITSTDIANWDTAYGWGNHATVGYLTSAVETLTGTANEIEVSASSGAVTIGLPDDVTIGGDLTVTGDLTVNGTTTTLNTETLAVEDNIVLLNKNVTGTPSANAGIEVERGDYTNASIYWNETANAWYISTPGDSNGAATAAEIATGGSLNIFSTVSDGTTTATADSSTDTLTFAAGTGLTVAVNATTDTVTYGLNSSADAAVGSVVLPDAKLGSATATAGTTATVVDSFSASTYSTAKYIVQMKKNSDVHVIEVLVTVDGSNNVYVTEYAEVISNASLGTTDAAYNAGNIDFTVTAAATGTVVKVSKTYIEA